MIRPLPLAIQPHLVMPTSSNVLRSGPGLGYPYRLSSGNDPDDESRQPARLDRNATGREDLPYKVELWDDAKKSVEQVLAVTAHGSIGYAAYYAATREYPDRYVTLRHKNSIISRWNAPQH
jgi:hypothetical protein